MSQHTLCEDVLRNKDGHRQQREEQALVVVGLAVALALAAETRTDHPRDDGAQAGVRGPRVLFLLHESVVAHSDDRGQRLHGVH